MALERPFQDELKSVLESVVSRFKFGGLEFSGVEGINSPAGYSDFPEAREIPFLIIETKRGRSRRGGFG